jgi:hypothetical protein
VSYIHSVVPTKAVEQGESKGSSVRKRPEANAMSNAKGKVRGSEGGNDGRVSYETVSILKEDNRLK